MDGHIAFITLLAIAGVAYLATLEWWAYWTTERDNTEILAKREEPSKNGKEGKRA